MHDSAEPLCVIPVSAIDALRWATGELSDADLALTTPLVPEAVFIVNLPDRHSHRRDVELVRYWAERGAVCLICRTSNPIVACHLKKIGCIQTFWESSMPVTFRYLGPPAAFAAWCEKWGISSPSPCIKRPS